MRADLPLPSEPHTVCSLTRPTPAHTAWPGACANSAAMTRWFAKAESQKPTVTISKRSRFLTCRLASSPSSLGSVRKRLPLRLTQCRPRQLEVQRQRTSASRSPRESNFASCRNTKLLRARDCSWGRKRPNNSGVASSMACHSHSVIYSPTSLAHTTATRTQCFFSNKASTMSRRLPFF